MRLPTNDECARNALTCGDIAREAYAGITYDHAIPIEWARDNPDLAASIVWAYPEGSLMGMPAPLTADAAIIMSDRGIKFYYPEIGS